MKPGVFRAAVLTLGLAAATATVAPAAIAESGTGSAKADVEVMQPTCSKHVWNGGGGVVCSDGTYRAYIRCTFVGPPLTRKWVYGETVRQNEMSAAYCPNGYVVHGLDDIDVDFL
ncbi:hypothetical protein SAMN02982929_03330 [Saccharopolyspora kobensis]|uniref:Secreted protein n=1 Tax=Saccharopolyspora kobensis TaxID=146035 RepID=A0A1H6CCY1_9PSEU|nr:hypothetical protein [Saccharopolyspora kobensis]SEG70880.1 hypothetical protein SAMN02982929_03330 [Saccharopolyspora kobensis]SFC36139.1 hypothetical protein SAMN05216506_101572 [Saccharopolyspora kobensis]